MALSSSRECEIPKDAVILDKESAVLYQWGLISNWDNKMDVWALRYCGYVFGAFSGGTSIYLNNYFRGKMRLGNYGRLSTYFPIVVLPTLLSITAHKMVVQKPILLNEPFTERGCPLCFQLKAAALQTSLGYFYPFVLAPVGAFIFTTRHFTYRLPKISQNPMDVLQLLRKLTRPIVPLMSGIFAGQVLITMYVTYKEMQQNLELQIKMQEIERKLENELNMNIATSI